MSAPDSVFRLDCPHCGALAQPGTVICASCGVNLRTYHATRSQMDEAGAILLSARQQDLSYQHEAMQAESEAKNKAWLSKAIRLVLFIGVAMVIMTIAASGWYVWQQHQRQLWLETEYNAGLACIEQVDYLCARNHLREVLDEEADYADADTQLRDVRYELAQQYLVEKEWAYAVTELELLLSERPGDVPSLALRREAYREWIRAALQQRDIALALQLRVRRDAPMSSE